MSRKHQIEQYERQMIIEMEEMTEEELNALENKLISFIQSIRKVDNAHLKFNAQVLAKIIQHHADALEIPFNEVLEHCNGMRDSINIESLRKSLYASS